MKYFGSKARIAKDIVPIIQKYIDNNDIHYYIEPFAGGCNIIDKIICDRKFAYDLNKYLIYLLIHVKEGKPLYDKVPKELYDKARSAWRKGNTSEFENWQIGCIMFLASYNGRDFSGGYAKDSYEKTSKGLKLRQYYQEAKRNLEQQAGKKGFKDIAFGIADYKDLELEKCDIPYVVYCDPPYQFRKTFANSEHFDYKEFWDVMREWSKKHIVIISELNAPHDFISIWEKPVRRTIKPSDKSIIANEKLFIWKDMKV